MSRDKRPEETDPDATIVHRPAPPEEQDPDATVVHRPVPADAEPDPDATVVHRGGPAPTDDADATVVHRASPAPADDPDATVMQRSQPAQTEDPDATVAHRAVPVPVPDADPDATVAHRAVPVPEPDPEATVAHRAPPAAGPDPEVTVVHRADVAAEPDPEATAAFTAMPAAPEPRFDPDSTVTVPTPGRRTTEAAEPPPIPMGDAAPPDTTPGSGLNPLVAAANPLLAAVPQFRWSVSHADPAGLRSALTARLREFGEAAAAAGVAAATVDAARAALCALIDEAVLSTPWGATSDWKTENLTRASGGGAPGGADFFDRLEALEADPDSDTDLLELFSICLAFGYEGRFRDAPNGRIALSQARDRIDELIRTRRARPEALPLSVHWEGVQTVQAAMPRALALWVTASLCAVFLGGTYFAYTTMLSDAAQPVYADLSRLKAKPVTLPPTARPAAAPAVRLSTLLAPQVKAGRLEVREDARTSTVTLNATDLFASGSAAVVEKHLDTIRTLASALDAVGGPVTVTGHTDSRPIRTARFPSNWELSRARADSVVKVMAGAMKQPGRLRAEGVADSQPVAPNDTEANRQRNRRVVFILEVQP